MVRLDQRQSVQPRSMDYPSTIRGRHDLRPVHRSVYSGLGEHLDHDLQDILSTPALVEPIVYECHLHCAHSCQPYTNSNRYYSCFRTGAQAAFDKHRGLAYNSCAVYSGRSQTTATMVTRRWNELSSRS